MRKIVLASALALTAATAANAGGMNPPAEVPEVTVVPAPAPAGSLGSLGGSSALIVAGILAALVAAAGSGS
ncbi:hypothetical protein [Marivivens aquimaris]|uniref:hypothetical protein n=1 Tax=Marivivens aquimaris TaxID=2774876 RepID=UPI00187F7EF9|nr:hypothetical protein [Marivivens aquimaris]